MKKIVMCLVVLSVVLLQGCGTWCAKDHSACVEGFSGFTRYQGYNYTNLYYYPVTVFTIANGSKNNNCYMDVAIDGIVMGKGIKQGEFRRIEIKSPQNENRFATVLVSRYCGGKPKGSYTYSIQVSSTQAVSHSWIVNERYFPR